MNAIQVTVTDSLTQELVSGRMACTATGEDSFDSRSWHCVAEHRGLCAGAVRITCGSPSVLASWTNGLFPQNEQDTQADLTRAFVLSEFRGKGIYRVLMLTALAWLNEQKISRVFGAIEPGFEHFEFLGGCGFQMEGESLLFRDTPRETIGQPIACTMELSGKMHRQQLKETIADLSASRDVDFEISQLDLN